MNFRDRSIRALNRPALQANLHKATATALHKREVVVHERADFEELRERGRKIRMEGVENLPAMVDRYTAAARRHGFQVHFAKDSEAACEIAWSILQKAGARSVVKGKSMVTEEIELRPFLERHGVDVLETDLGEYLVQIAGEMPSHITAPALHMSRAEIGRLLSRVLGVPYSDDPPTLVAIAREHLRKKFFAADAGMSGANFLCADTGTLVLLENEGNIRLSITLPKLHIAVAGIEKIVPRFSDIPTLLALLPRSATGQKITTYVSCLTRTDGTERHIILLDNGRGRIQKDPELREILSCIKCGACLNVCPVYQRVGGHTYNSIYPGPIGSIWTPAMSGMQSGTELPFASSLCGSCTDICPVKIPIHHLLLSLRSRGPHPLWKRALTRIATWVMASPGRYAAVSHILRRLPRSLTGRAGFSMAPRSFRDLYR